MEPKSLLKGLTRACVALFLLLTSVTGTAQVDVVLVFGTVKDMSTAKKLDGVIITVFKNGAKLVEVPTNASGKYEVNLDYGAEYKIMCSKAGFVGKNIAIDTRNIPEEDRQGGHGMNIDFTMMVDIPDVDFSILQQPFGKAKYVPGSGNFEWDMEYTTGMRDAQARLLKEYEEKKKREANADVDFAKQMADGNAAMTAQEYKKAIGSFTAALAIKANDPVAKARLSDAQMHMESAEANKKLDEQYADLIEAADALFGKKDYAAARAKYDAASDLKNKEPYPPQKIKEIDVLMAEAAKKAEEERLAKELQQKYQGAITAADAAFKAESWDQATTKYSEASGLKPEEKYPKDQLAAIATKRDEAARKAEEARLAKELEEKYKAALVSADAAFKAANWDAATAKYTEAGALKPEEKYPKDQLALIVTKRDEAAQKAEAERLAKELKEKYQAAIRDADLAFNGARYEDATAKYTEASGLKPEEKYPKDQLALIQKKLDELAMKSEEERKAKELEEQYKAIIIAADAAFNAAQWEEAVTKYTEASTMRPAERYPKDQIAAIARKKDELAKKAEEERQARELDERYQGIIAAADAAFNAEQWTEATAKYTEAAGVKPQEMHPKERIATIKDRMAAAEAKRKQDELDAKYQAAIAEADAAFGKEDFTKAKTGYQEASTLKPQERYPKDRLAEIEAHIAEQARLAEEKRKQEELETRYTALIRKADQSFDAKKLAEALNDYRDALQLKPGEAHPQERITAIEQQLDAAAQAKAEEDRLAREKQDRDRRYSELITTADRAFGSKQYEEARGAYSDALGVKPDERHPQDRLVEIERILGDLARQAGLDREAADREAAERARKAEADRLAAELAAADKAKLDEEARRRQMEDAEAERARLEAERLAREQMDAEARRLLEEKERLEREGAKAIEERYRSTIVAADEALAAKEYDRARGIYAEASDLKPNETYPLAKIDQIDKLLAEAERMRREAELAAQQARQADAERPRQNTTIDVRKEEEAEQFMMAAREREEAEKYERIRKFRSALQSEDSSNASAAADRRMGSVQEKARIQEGSAGLYQGDESRRGQNATDMVAYRQALEQAEAERVRRSAETRGANYEAKVGLEEQFGERDRTWDMRHTQNTNEAVQRTEDIRKEEEQRAEDGLARNGQARSAAVEQGEHTAQMQERGNDLVDEKRRAVEEEKRARQARENGYTNHSEQARQHTQQQLDATPGPQQRAFADYNRSKLAQEYPPGVTEESYTEGNKVIIRRVVVNGNKADEYSKVIAKWGTFYFKNGQSITEAIWSKETEG
ncbi:MAG: hypothetical protein ABI432_12415 [Flavobacteriales bacterium]